MIHLNQHLNFIKDRINNSSYLWEIPDYYLLFINCKMLKILMIYSIIAYLLTATICYKYFMNNIEY
jgi:hypothetical protein